jgi:DNA polymerase (family 10)
MILGKAQRLAEQLVKELLPHCKRVEIAGSIRRKKDEVNDIDLVLIPKPLLKHGILTTLQRKMNAEITKKGDKVAQVVVDGVKVDLYYASEENFAGLLLFRTGSMRNNLKLASRARSIGLRLTHYGVFRDNERVDDNTEEGIYRVLELDYRSPEERE